ncbi:MAG: prepilin peptidase [Anaerolineales bacterium]|nr:prepilin peptidase [Anaerolineales bacterium]
MLNLLFALLGLIVGVVINALADDLPQRKRPSLPHCHACQHRYTPMQWLGVGQCAQCAVAPRRRVLWVVVGTAVLFALLPTLIPEPVNLWVNALYTAVFILVIVIDLEHKLILNVVTFPATAVALLLSFVVTDNNIRLALVGAVVGFVLFYIAYWIGQLMFGPGALGYGDVKLAMAMGAMLGFHRILFALGLAIVLGGVISGVLLLSRRFHRYTYLPYGQYLAIAGIIMLIWGVRIAEWYAQSGQ